MKKLSIILMCAFAAMANCGKADIVSAQELPNGRIIVNDPTAVIGSGEEQVKTPWMIVSPDGTRGFANDFTTNAISLVSEDGTNFGTTANCRRTGPYGPVRLQFAVVP